MLPNIQIFTRFGDIPILDFGSDGGGVTRRIEHRNLPHATLAVLQRGPNRLNIMPKRIDHPNPSYNHTASHQRILSQLPVLETDARRGVYYRVRIFGLGKSNRQTSTDYRTRANRISRAA